MLHKYFRLGQTRRFSALTTTLSFLILFAGVKITQAQQTGWSSITSYNSVNGIDASEDDTIWGVSNGGLFSFKNKEFTNTFTPVDGMYRLDGLEIIYLQELNSVVIGYIDGMMDLYNIDDGQFDRVEDISRVKAFTSKRINDFELYDGSLYVATEFGVVIYDTSTFLVSNSYTKIGSFDRGSPVNDVTIGNGTIYLGGQQGVAVADLEDNLDIESSWTNYDQSDGLSSGTVQSVSIYNGTLYASSASSNYILQENNWVTNLLLSNYTNIIYKEIDDDRLVMHTTDRILIADQNEIIETINPGINTISDLSYQVSNMSPFVISTITAGIGLNDNSVDEFEFYAPQGPNLNFFEGMSFRDGIFISGTTRLNQRNSFIDNRKGYYIKDESGWRNFNRDNNQVLNQFRFRQGFTSTFTDQYFYFGGWGSGIVRHDRETDVIDVFNSSNSTLRGWAADDPGFPVISGLETDENEAVWATSRYATNPLYVQLQGEDEWINYAKSPAVRQNDEYLYLFVDSHNQKWVTLQSAGGAGRGVLVLDTGDPSVTGESTGVKLTDDQGNGNLPDISVTAIIEDREGEVWVGTERGIARFIFPQFVITGSREERRAQWLINEDPEAASPFLLRDISVTAMAVNAANQKWIGTATEGVWLLNQTGSAILKRFTSENSPLFSNAIRDIAVNDETGEVYFSTDAGLSIFQDIPTSASSSMDELKVYPNPFLYERHSSITIENLSEITTLRVLGVDGSLIRVIENRSGRATWDGRDSNGREVGSGVYIIVALGQEGDERGIGKVAIIK